jgi:hypothetical protein
VKPIDVEEDSNRRDWESSIVLKLDEIISEIFTMNFTKDASSRSRELGQTPRCRLKIENSVN